jgi:hypothetical protein
MHYSDLQASNKVDQYCSETVQPEKTQAPHTCQNTGLDNCALGHNLIVLPGGAGSCVSYVFTRKVQGCARLDVHTMCAMQAQCCQSGRFSLTSYPAATMAAAASQTGTSRASCARSSQALVGAHNLFLDCLDLFCFPR